MTKNKRILPRDFYVEEDVLNLSQKLLGKYLFTQVDQQITAGMIVETEAYYGIQDKACHAYNSRRTERTEVMYALGGVAYVYLCYGLHHLFNIVTAGENTPHAILIRAIEPVEGVPAMLKRRKMSKLHYRLTAGPGSLTQALGINRQLNGSVLTQQPIWLEDHHIKVAAKDIIASPRVGIDYAQEYRDLPWRFRLKNSLWTSPAR